MDWLIDCLDLPAYSIDLLNQQFSLFLHLISQWVNFKKLELGKSFPFFSSQSSHQANRQLITHSVNQPIDQSIERMLLLLAANSSLNVIDLPLMKF